MDNLHISANDPESRARVQPRFGEETREKHLLFDDEYINLNQGLTRQVHLG